MQQTYEKVVTYGAGDDVKVTYTWDDDGLSIQLGKFDFGIGDVNDNEVTEWFDRLARVLADAAFVTE